MSKFMDWVDARFPATKMWEDHLSKYYAPKNFNFFYFFGGTVEYRHVCAQA